MTESKKNLFFLKTGTRIEKFKNLVKPQKTTLFCVSLVMHTCVQYAGDMNKHHIIACSNFHFKSIVVFNFLMITVSIRTLVSL